MNLNKNFTFVVILIAFIFSGCSEKEIQKNSLLLKITGNGVESPSYIYGTIHIKDARVFDFSDSVLIALKSCSSFGMEVITTEENKLKITQNLQLPVGVSLLTIFSNDEYEQLGELLKLQTGHDIENFNNMSPLILISLINSSIFKNEMNQTLDEHLYQRALENRKRTFGLESVEEQIALIDKISYQDIFNEIIDIEKQKALAMELLHAYIAADLEKFYKVMMKDKTMVILKNEFLRIRNQRILQRIIEEIHNEPTFFAISAAHLGAGTGLIVLLKKEGYTVSPVL
ncbi:MAG: TraB/GumN family protein [Bacteroidia bacterium]|nr:TraB/GumN family protein [Bacteroidia bacterium]